MREKLIQERKQLSAEFREQAAADILQQLIKLPEFNSAKNIALYLAVNGEVETKHIIETCWRQAKNVFLPVVQNDMSLLFYQYQKNDILQKNKKRQISQKLLPRLLLRNARELIPSAKKQT